MTVEADIEALKQALGVDTATGLAEALGLQRSALSQWKARGSIPQKYLILARPPTDGEIASALDNALRLNVFGRRENAYWLRAALALLPAADTALADESPADRGARLERLVLRLMNRAMVATAQVLHKEHCESDDDCNRIITALAADGDPS
jgi:hypothetical protein